MSLNQSFYYKKNRLQQLKCFYYTALLGQPTKAASTLGITQSAVSMQVKSLESDFKTLLFHRKQKKLSLTYKGKILYDIITPHIQAIENVIDIFNKQVEYNENNVINIAANHVSISYILPEYLCKMQSYNNNIKFKIKNIAWSEGIQKLLEGELEFAVYPCQTNKVPSECEFFPIKISQPILLLEANHPLAKRTDVSLSEISNYNLIRIDKELITLPAFEEIINAHNLKTNTEFENADWEILKKFVKAKIGVAIISNICLEKDDNLIGIPLTQYFPEMVYGILMKKGMQLNQGQSDFFNLITGNDNAPDSKKLTALI